MVILHDFDKLEFLQKICLLQDIGDNKNFEAAPELFNLYENPLGDDAVDYMVTNTLRELLGQNEQLTVDGLKYDGLRVKKLCIQLSGEKRFQTAAPLILDMVDREKYADLLREIMVALDELRPPEYLGICRKLIFHPDMTIASLAIESLGSFQDRDSMESLMEIISTGEADEQYHECSLVVWKAIETLGGMPGESPLSFLVSKIHHRNPAARRIIHQVLVAKGLEVIPFLEKIFDGTNNDHIILASNILGLIGDKKGGELMVRYFDRGLPIDPNVKYSMYEAFGNISFMKGLICLTDGLTEKDTMILTAVVSSLNRQVNPGIIKKISQLIQTDPDQGQRLLQAIVTSTALNIFEQLYQDENLAVALIDKIRNSRDKEIVSEFNAKLEKMEGPLVKTGLEKTKGFQTDVTGIKVLAVDDSKAMRLFYRTALSDMGLEVLTAANGQDALNLLELGEEAHLIVTDMNMPVMDGIEFTRQARNLAQTKDIPIIMITTESEASQIKLAENAGVNILLKKPFSPETLQEKARQLLGEKQVLSLGGSH